MFDLESLVRPNVIKLKPYSSARDEFRELSGEKIFIDANENPYDNGVNRYPDPHHRELKQKLSELKGVNPNQILVGNGSDEVLDMLIRVFCEPKKDTIITLPPTYGMYGVLADLNDIENHKIFLTKDFQPNLDEILRTQGKILFLCSPNNPTGNSIEPKLVEAILKKFEGIVVIDEAYIDFSPQKSWLTQLSKFSNLVISQTLSKAYGMAGLRLGICYASSEIITLLTRIKPPYNVNVLSQKEAIKNLNNRETTQEQVNVILSEKKRLNEALLGCNFVVKVYPSDANFILAVVDEASPRYQQFLDKNIVSRNRSREPLCENTLRFTIGTPEENNALIAAMRAIDKNPL